MAEALSIIYELALRVSSAILNKHQSKMASKSVVMAWANWYMNRWSVFQTVETESEERLIEFRKNLQWMGDQMTQQLGAIRGSLDERTWNKANEFARQVWMIGRKLYPRQKFRRMPVEGIPSQDQNLALDVASQGDFLKSCHELKVLAEELMKN